MTAKRQGHSKLTGQRGFIKETVKIARRPLPSLRGQSYIVNLIFTLYKLTLQGPDHNPKPYIRKRVEAEMVRIKRVPLSLSRNGVKCNHDGTIQCIQGRRYTGTDERASTTAAILFTCDNYPSTGLIMSAHNDNCPGGCDRAGPIDCPQLN